MTTLKRTFAKRLERYISKPNKQAAYLGLPDGITIRVPGKNHWMYATLPDGSSVEGYNRGNVPASPGLAIWLIYENQTYYIEARQAYPDQVSTSIPDGIETELQWPNSHTTYIRPEQFLPGLVYPKSGLIVYVYGGVLKLTTGFVNVPGGEVDLSAAVPASGAQWAVVYIVSDGTLGMEYGGAAASVAELDYADIPEVSGYPLAAIKMSAGMTSIQHGKFGSVIVDLRWFQPSGGGAITLPENRIIATDDTGQVAVNAPFWDENGQARWTDNPDFEFPAASLLGLYLAGESIIPGISMIYASSSASASRVNFVKYGSSLLSPSAVQSGWRLGSFSFGGHYGDGIDFTKARISAEATQNWINSNRGAKVKIEATPSDSSTMQSSAEFSGDRIDLLQAAYAPTPPGTSDDTRIPTTEWVRDFSQPLDSDLTAIAGLTPSNDDIIQRKSGAWTNRTMAQLINDILSQASIYSWDGLPASGLTASVAAGATKYMPFFYYGLYDSTYQTKMPRACIVKNLRFSLISAQPASGSLVVTLYKVVSGSASATSITITIPAGSSFGEYSDLSHSVSLGAGDGLYLQIVNNATSSSGGCGVTVLERGILLSAT